MFEWHKKSKLLMVMCVCLMAVACAPADRHFWYPIKLIHATCDNFVGEMYLMENSIGWSAQAYFLERKTKQRIQLPTDCVIRTIKRLPIHESEIQDKLTAEQQQYLIEGF